MTDAAPRTPRETIEGTAVSALLAHRFPFLLIDLIDIVQPGRRVIGRKRITVGEWWNEGTHGPAAIFPFSLVSEAMAQTSAASMRDLVDGAEGAVAYFMVVTRLRLRHAARPGDELAMELTTPAVASRHLSRSRGCHC